MRLLDVISLENGNGYLLALFQHIINISDCVLCFCLCVCVCVCVCVVVEVRWMSSVGEVTELQSHSTPLCGQAFSGLRGYPFQSYK